MSKYQVIFDHAPLGMVTMDSSGGILFTNQKVESMLGIPGMDLRAKYLYEFSDPADADSLRTMFADLTSGEIEKFQLIGRYLGENRERAWWRLDVRYVHPEDHTPFILAIIDDITSQKNDEENLRKAKEAAERATKTKSAFLANMSHEIRTPLHTISGTVELMSETALDEEQREYVEQLRFAGDVLLALINDILDFSKIEAGKLTLDKFEFPLRESVEDAIDMVSLQAHQKGLETAITLDPTLPSHLHNDPTRLRQVLVNLVNNAVKFTPKGEISCSVSRREAKGKKLVLFEVRDTGIGIPEEKRAKLFRAFSQVDASTTRRFGGTGLGLSISRDLVHMMGGKIGVKSKEGAGSLFWFTLPVDDRLDDECIGDEVRLDAPAYRVLLVDDNETSRESVSRYLRFWNAKVDHAVDGAEGLRKLREAVDRGEPFDVAFVDLLLPGMDGWQLASEINADKKINSTALVLMSPTGESSGEAKMKLLKWFNAYISKPVRILELRDAYRAATQGDLDLAEAEGDGEELEALEPLEELREESPSPFRRVVVAEDHYVNQQLFSTILEKHGYETILASTGVEAVAAVRENEVDLVFMDVQMPEMNGYEASRQIREEGFSLPIVAVTANAIKGERERCLAAGMDDFLTKPFKPRDVLPFLRRLEEGGYARKEKESPAPETPSGEWLGAEESAPVSQEPYPTDEHPDDEIGPTEPPWDRASALDSFMGQEEVLNRVVSNFLVKCDRQIEELRQLVDARQFTDARILAHAIKGGAWNLSAKPLGDAAAILEETTKLEDLESSKAQLPAVRARFEEFRRALSELVDSVG
ncbi:MAG: response regulator [Spirochaetaceae bacterium]